MPEANIEPGSPYERARSAAGRMLRWNGLEIGLRPAAPAVAVPMFRAVENDCWQVAADHDRAFLKVPSPDMALLLNPSAAFEAIAIAAERGLTPSPLAFDAVSGAAAITQLDEHWHTAFVDELPRGSTRARLIGLKRRLHDGPTFPRSRSVFAHLDELYRIGDTAGVLWPDDHGALADYAARIESGFLAAGYDARPCHGDGHASNVMLGPDGAVLLVDFDFAANNDPYYDLAALLLEIEPWDDGIAEAVEIYNGTFDAKVMNRVKLHMILDDIVWARLALIAAQMSTRRHIEFLKYGEFRLLRCRYHLRFWPVDDMLRRM